MDGFTFQKENRKNGYEKYEWDNLWIEHADEPEALRVLYIGDSISCGIRQKATAKTNEQILFDGFGTSKAVDNPYFKDAVRLFSEQQADRKAILFNNGLHGFHLSEKDYAFYYEDMIKFLISEFKNTPVAVVSTTHINDAEGEKKVIERNRAAISVAGKYKLPAIDLYGISLKNADMLLEDGVHFKESGYEHLADEIVKGVKLILQSKR